MALLTDKLDRLPDEPVEVSSLPEDLRSWIKSVYRGCSPYFELPERVSFRQVRQVQRWKVIDRDRRVYEKRWGERLANDFEEWGKRVGRVYERTQSEGAALDQIDDIFRKDFRNELADLWIDVGSHFYRIAEDEIQGKAASTDFDELDPLDDAEFSAYVQRVVAQKVTFVTASTKRMIADIIDRGLRDGASIRDIVAKIETGLGFSRHRGFLIARTETIGASNASTHFAYGKNFDRASLEKEWLATQDARTRTTHTLANGQRVGFTEQFSIGAAKLDFPADTASGAGHPEEVINCRCTVQYHGGTPQPQARRPRQPRTPKPSPVPLGDLSAATVRQQVIDELEGLSDEIALLHQKRKDLQAELKRKLSAYRTSQTLENAKTYNESFDRFEDLTKKQLPKLYKRNAKQFLDIWNPTGKKSTEFEFVKDSLHGKQLAKSKTDEAKRFLEGLGGLPKHKKLTIHTGRIPKIDKKRASQYDRYMNIRQPDGTWKKEIRATIRLDSKHTPETYIHESGHAIDALADEYANEVEKLYKRRTANDTDELLSALTGEGYGPNEVTKRDKWLDFYQGRNYSFRNRAGTFASEVTSMGLQQLYENPRALAVGDPELFDFLWDAFAKPIP